VLARRAIPTPDSMQVLVKLEAAMVRGLAAPSAPSRCGGCGARPRALLPCDDVCGVIVGLGSSVDARAFRINQRVVVEPFRFCGCCFFCDRGQTNLCEHGDTLDAGLQEYIAVDCRMVHTVHEEVNRSCVVLTAVTANVSSALSKACILPGDSVLVVGSDIHALVAIIFVRCLGADFICVVGRPGDKATDSAYACGARQLVPWEDDTDEQAAAVQQAIQQNTDGRGFDVVFCPDSFTSSDAFVQRMPAQGGDASEPMMESAGDEAAGSRHRHPAECSREHMRAQRSLTLAMRSVRKGGSVVRCCSWPRASSPTLLSCETGHPCSASDQDAVAPSCPGNAPQGVPHANSDPNGTGSGAGFSETTLSGEGRGAGAEGPTTGDGGAGPTAREAEAEAHGQLLQQCLASDVRFIGVRGFSSSVFVQGLRWIESHLLDLAPLSLVRNAPERGRASKEFLASKEYFTRSSPPRRALQWPCSCESVPWLARARAQTCLAMLCT